MGKNLAKKISNLNKVPHPRGRKAAQLAKKTIRAAGREKVKLLHQMKVNILGEKLLWFKKNLNSVGNYTPELTINLIEKYLGRFDDELNQINLKHATGKRKGRQHASREDVIKMTIQNERNEFLTCGIEMPDVLNSKQLELLRKWSGELRYIQNFKLIRYNKGKLASMIGSVQDTKNERENSEQLNELEEFEVPRKESTLTLMEDNILNMIEKEKEDETPISSKPESPAPEIFSSKKIFFLNSSFSGNRRSEIPHIESDYCPRDEVGRRLFHHNNDSCDCDCTSDKCGGCLRRNKQCFFKIFVLALSISLILLFFGSLSYNLTRNKDVNESLRFDKTKWVSHYHEYSALEEHELPRGNATVFAETEPVLNLPVPVYEHLGDYDSSEDLRRLHYYSDDNLFRGSGRIEPIPFPPFKDQKENSQKEILIIYDGREPLRIKRSIPWKSKTEEKSLLNEKLRKERITELNHEPLFEELNAVEEGMERFWENYFKKGRTVFEPFSLTTPIFSTSVQSDEYSVEEEIEDELRNKFLSLASSGNFDSMKSPRKEISKDSWDINRETVDRTEITELYVNSFSDQTKRTETENHNDHEWTTTTISSYFPTESKVVVTESSEPQQSSFTTNNFKNSRIVTEVDHTLESNFEPELYKNAKIPLSVEDEALNEVTTMGKITSDRELFKSSTENSKAVNEDKREFRTLWPFFHFSVPLAGLFSSTQQDQFSAELAPLDTVKGISLADAKKIKNERRKLLLLNSRVVGGSSDVRLPTGPDISKPIVNAFETLKTNQQLSFTPSAASQFILPYQMCLFAGSFPSRPFVHAAQPRTFSLGASPLIPSIFDKNSPANSPYQVPPQQNFLSFNINNYANVPPPRQQTQTSGSSIFSFPTQHQFSQFQAPNKQPIFCTYLQPPLFQFPTVPGTADFSHAKCIDCTEDSQRDSSFAKESIFPSGREILCSDDRVSCTDGSGCIPLENWCDNQVHCKDASDETFCSCRERLVKDRLCDGYIDCPHGEDEISCFDCPKSAFNCDSVISPESCIPLSKRCDGIRDCVSGADERDCSALFFGVRQNNSYQVSQISGYLHHNWKGDWFPVCVEIDDNIWAKEACLGELGVLPSSVDVKFARVSDYYKGPFIVRKEDGTPALQDHCKGHVSTFIKCPAMNCGTRVELHSLQKLENQYFQTESDAKKFASSTFTRESLMKTAPNADFFINEKLQREEDHRLKREETGRVVGGRESEPRAWPWAIAIYKNGAFHCGGVILDEKWVLTAAHCMEQYWKHYYEVRGGMLRRFSFSAMEQARSVSHVIMHESYDLTIMSSDLALLRLQKPFHFNRWIRPACLPVLEDGISKFASGPAPGTRCTAVGWGALRERGTDPDQLREVEIPIMNKCKHKEDLVGEEICAGKAEGGKDTCQGDSGGPLLCRDSSSLASWYVAGIVSHGEGCARPGEPGAYTRISLFIDWITANTKDFQLPSLKPLQDCPGFRCQSASKLCIPRKWVCNGYTDCLEAEDEKNCAFDSATPNFFNRKYSNKYNYFESENIEGSKLGKNPEESLVSKTTMNALEKEKEKEKALKIKEEAKAKELPNEKDRNGETEELFDVKHNAESHYKYSDQVRTMVALLLTPTATTTFTVRTTEQPSASLGNLKMEKMFIMENMSKLILTTESTKDIDYFIGKENENYRTLSTENIIQEKCKTKTKNEKEENTKEDKRHKERKTEEMNEDLNKKNNEEIKEREITEEETIYKDVVLLEEEEEKTKNIRNKMTHECKEMQNATVSEKIELGRRVHEKMKQESGINENNEEFEEKKMDYQKFEVKEEEINEDREKKEKEGGKKTRENSTKTEKVESKVEDNTKEKESSEEEKKNLISTEDWETENFSFLGNSSTTEIFATNTLREMLKETFIDADKKENRFTTESINFKQTEIFEKNSDGEETQTQLKLIEQIIIPFSTTETAKDILETRTFEPIISNTEYMETESTDTVGSARVTLSQSLIRTTEAEQTRSSSEDYSAKIYYSVTDATKTNSESESILGSEYFQCRLIVQSVLASYRCDGLEDCEDGSDEENCTYKSNSKQICDDLVDYRSDEKNCFECLENEFHCKNSNECIPLQKKCNGATDCRFGEDEAKCMALADGAILSLHADTEPILETEGILMINKNGIWAPKCQEEMSVLAAKEAITICSALGTVGYERFENRSLVSYNCTGFYVSCAKNLISSVNRYQNVNGSYLWPWNAFVYSDGLPVCSAVLLQSRWLLTSSHCLKDVSLKKNYLIAKLGSKNWSSRADEKNAKIIRIDGAQVIPESEVALLHLSREVNQTESVRPLGIPYAFFSNPITDLCLAVGDRTVFLKISEDCSENYRCFRRVGSIPSGCKSKPWTGVIVCQSVFGWYPASVFLEKSGNCGFEKAEFSSLQEHLKPLLHALDQKVEIFPEPDCFGFRCSQGLCIPHSKKCNGVPDCSSEEDENFDLCSSKNQIKECKITELKCRNGRCIPKVSFGDGTNDCGDKSDEPLNITCVEYLRLTAPERICDGRRNCYDKTDEDYKLCSCEVHKFQCKLSGYCIPTDFVCDGEKDCPGGEDEEQCMGRQIVKNYSNTHLEVMQKSYGIWHTVCLSRLTKEYSDSLCRDLGFRVALFVYEKNQTIVAPKVDAFSWVKLNRKTSIALRGDKPFVRLVTLRKTCGSVKCA